MMRNLIYSGCIEKKKTHQQSMDYQCVFVCGAGGSRTLVQTSRKSAFYKFSLCLLVGYCMVHDEPNSGLSSKVSRLHRSLHLLSVPL